MTIEFVQNIYIFTVLPPLVFVEKSSNICDNPRVSPTNAAAKNVIANATQLTINTTRRRSFSGGGAHSKSLLRIRIEWLEIGYVSCFEYFN